MPEISQAKLTRRKQTARNYENVVKKDATFFQALGNLSINLKNLICNMYVMSVKANSYVK